VTGLLVIGYGNELRGDDAVGPAAAETVASWRPPGVRAIACAQLTPELAADVAEAARVVFVDAALAESVDDVALRPVEATTSAAVFGHLGGPGWLLELARTAFGRVPPAWCVTVPAVGFGLGEGLSPAARAGLERALAIVRTLCADAGPTARPASPGAALARA
jgi:hydrogenase maturation protease